MTIRHSVERPDGTARLDDIAARYAVSGITLTRAFTRHGLAG